MADLILGPCLRYVGETDATVWVETSAACEVEVLGRRTRTFHVEGHHYALVIITDLAPGQTYTYDVRLDGEPVWPRPDDGFPPSVIRTIDPQRPFTLVFGSCRDAAPNEPPYTLTRKQDKRGREIDALRTYALRMQRQDRAQWPDALLLLGDQVYADDVSPHTLEFIKSRRDTDQPPGEGVADFEEYTHLYHESWGDPVVRWLLSTLSTSMIFDDHDVHDDWNTSAAWVADMRRHDWWDARIIGGLTSYWIYQHLGNLSPADIAEDGLLARVIDADDAGPMLRDFAAKADRVPSGSRWSYRRDFGSVRMLVIDSRCGRILDGGRRDMLDDREWDWLHEQVTGDYDHLVVATTLPYLLGHGTHNLETWNEAVCAGAWGRLAARVGEQIRQAADLEHWAAFERSFARLTHLLHTVASGQRGEPPETIVVASGDVHHAYLAQLDFRGGPPARSRVYQAVCSPIRNPVEPLVRRIHRFGMSRAAAVILGALARAAGVSRPPVDWRITRGPWFNNQIATLGTAGRQAHLRIERTKPGEQEHPRLHCVLDQELAAAAPVAARS